MACRRDRKARSDPPPCNSRAKSGARGWARPSPVEPDVLHAPAVEDAVVHQGQPLDFGLPTGALAHEEDDRAYGVIDQPALDLPDELLALGRVALRRLPVDQRIDFGIASGIIARRPARVILVELVVGVVDRTARKTHR